MLGLPGEFFCIVEAGLGVERTFKVKRGSAWKVLEVLWHSEAFIFEQLKDGGWGLVGTVREHKVNPLLHKCVHGGAVFQHVSRIVHTESSSRTWCISSFLMKEKWCW